METDSLFEKIKSKYIQKKIFSYIKNENFIYKFFLYSKAFQKKLELENIDFKERYIIQSKISYDNYLCCYSLFNVEPKKFDKKIIEKKLQEELTKFKLDKNIFKECILNYFKKFVKKDNEEEKDKKDKKEKTEKNIKNEKKLNKQIISIYSPFFDDITKTEYFEELTISISVKLIERYNLKNDYISAFDKLNKLNLKYPCISFLYTNSNDINYLKELNIRFAKIKKFTASHEYSVYIDNYDYFFKTLFSFNSIEKNLISLNLYVGFIKKDKIDPNSIKNLNSLISLEILELKGFKFKTTFVLKLKNLKNLILKNCENLTFDGNSCTKLKQLYLQDCAIVETSTLLKLPELEECLLQNSVSVKRRYNQIIDFASLKNLKFLTAEAFDFTNIENTILEKIILYSYNVSSDIEKIMFEKLFSISNLKDLTMEIKDLGDEEISKIPGDNCCVINLNIKWLNNFCDCDIRSMQNKFPNVSYISLYTPYKRRETNLDIIEDPKCKIDKFSLNIGGNKDITFFCISYDKLILVDFFVSCEIVNILKSFPLFSENCQVKFSSLTHFKYTNYSNEVKMKFLENIYNNFDKLPSLRQFEFYCIAKEINEDFYYKFIRLILPFNLSYVNFAIKKASNESNELYSEDEIKELFPDLSHVRLDRINIRKFTKKISFNQESYNLLK